MRFNLVTVKVSPGYFFVCVSPSRGGIGILS